MTDTQIEQPAASKDPSPALAFALDRLRMDPDVTFLDVRDAAKLAGLVIYPIVFAKARSILGLAPPMQRRRRVQREPAQELPPADAAATPDQSVADAADQAIQVPSVEPAAVWTPPPAEAAPVNGSASHQAATKRPRKTARGVRPTPSETLDSLVAYVRSIEEERDRLWAALNEIRQVLREVQSETR